MIEDKTPVLILIRTSERAILREINENLYDGDHNYGPLLDKICDFAVHEFMREYRNLKENQGIKNKKENLEELRDIIVSDTLPLIQTEITGLEVPITRSFFDKMFKK